MAENSKPTVDRNTIDPHSFKAMIQLRMKKPKNKREREYAETCDRELVSYKYYQAFMVMMLWEHQKMGKYIESHLGLSLDVIEKIYHCCLYSDSGDNIEAEALEVICNPVKIKAWWSSEEACLDYVAGCVDKDTQWVKDMLEKNIAPYVRYYETHIIGFIHLLGNIRPSEPQEYEPGKATQMLKTANEFAATVKAHGALRNDEYFQLEESKINAEKKLHAYIMGALAIAFEHQPNKEEKDKGFTKVYVGPKDED